MAFEPINDIVHIVVEGVSYWNSDDLLRCQPRRERTRIVFGEHSHESLNPTKYCPVGHHWTLTSTIGCLIFQVKTFRQVKVQLNSRHLPSPSKRITCLY